MKKKVLWIIGTIIVLAALIFVIKAFIPRPIADLGIEEIILVEANFNYGEEDSKLENIHFIPDKVIECISKYKEQRTFVRHKGYAMKNVQLSVLIRTNSNIKEIIIGKDIYCQGGFGPGYRILNAEQFKKELFRVCGYNEDI